MTTVDIKARPPCFMYPFSKKFPSGTKLIIVGKPIPDNPIRFELDLEIGEGESRDVALHVNPRFPQREIVTNSYDHKNGWGTEHRNGMLLLAPGVRFKMEIECDDEGLKVILNEVPVVYFPHRYPPETITHLKVSRDVIIEDIKYIPVNSKIVQKEMSHLGLGKEGLPFSYQFHQLHKFIAGSKLIVEMSKYEKLPLKDQDKIDFVCGASGDIALSLSLSFPKREFIANSQVNKKWGAEHRNALWVLSPGVKFRMEIECQEEGFKVVLNEIPMTFFRHRMNPEDITDLQITGHVIIHEVIDISLMQKVSKKIDKGPFGVTPGWEDLDAELRLAASSY